MNNGRIKNWLKNANANLKLPGVIFGGLILAIGIIVRVNFVYGSDFPLNDGGFFYGMTEELINNQFSLPKYTLYNHADIPYVYPPLGFYLIGIIHKTFGFSLLSLFTYFPLFVSCLTIPVFYFLSTRFFKEHLFRLLSVYLFATLPRSFEWFVMGGGATRSLGFLFAMLSIYFLWDAFKGNKLDSKWIWGIIFSALTILTHPLSSLFLAFSVVVLLIYHYPVNIKLLMLSGIVVLAATSPWWGTALYNHGLSPFLGASGTGHLDWFEIKNLVTLNFGYENPYFLHIISVLAVLGVFSKRKKISITLGILCVVGYLVIPRGAADYLTAYLPILATIGFQAVTDPWNSDAPISEDNKQYPAELKSRKSRVFLVFIFIYVFIGAYTYRYVYDKGNLRVNDSNLEAMAWLQENTLETDTVLLIPVNDENRYWWNDYISEWLPVLTKRESLTTIQGYEWKPDIFEERISKYWLLRNCSMEYTCIENWQNENGVFSEYIYFDNLSLQRSLSIDFLESENYSVVFENDKVMIIEYVSE